MSPANQSSQQAVVPQQAVRLLILDTNAGRITGRASLSRSRTLQPKLPRGNGQLAGWD